MGIFTSQSPLVGASGPAELPTLRPCGRIRLNPLWSGLLGRQNLCSECHRAEIASQSPLVGASGPAPNIFITNDFIVISLNPLWSGLLGRHNVSTTIVFSCCSVSIPSGRGFWAGQRTRGSTVIRSASLNPLWSGLLGRPLPPYHNRWEVACLNPLWSGLLGRPCPCSTPNLPELGSQSPLVGASGPASIYGELTITKNKSQSPLVGASGPA